MAHLATLQSGSEFSVHPLETQMGNAGALLSGVIPRSGTIIAKEAYDKTMSGWRDVLVAAVTEVVSSEKRKPLLTSCYLKSLNFAAEYFGQRPNFSKQLVWIGDLIEDCHSVPAFYAVALPHDGMKRLDRLPQMPSLAGVSPVGILVPRGTDDHAGQIDPDVVAEYWRRVLPELGIDVNKLRIGSPAVLGLDASKF